MISGFQNKVTGIPYIVKMRFDDSLVASSSSSSL